MTKKDTGKYNSKIIEALLNEISPIEHKMAERKMMLAIFIEDLLKAKGLKKGDLAKALKKQPSEISKWLSGTHNFTTETLWQIGDVLGIDLINLRNEKREQTIYIASASLSQKVYEPFCFPFPQNIPGKIKGSFQVVKR